MLEVGGGTIKFDDLNPAGNQMAQEFGGSRRLGRNLDDEARRLNIEHGDSGEGGSVLGGWCGVLQNLYFVKARLRRVFLPQFDYGAAAFVGLVLAVGYEGDAGADFFQIHKNVRRNQNRNSLLVETLELVSEVHTGHGVESGGGLVEQQNLRGVEERFGEEEALLHAEGKFFDITIAARSQA